jgi:tetratricopeptide (TPR) repeat protein
VHGDKSQGETKINEAIDLLESLDNKNTETLALLAYLQSYSIQFSPGMQAGILSRKALKNAQKSKEANPKNLRAWYVLGMLDFYTPKNYGGQTECEEYLLKAIDLDEINNINPYLPTWGKDDAYALLLQYYISNDDMEKASSTFQRAMNVYPDNPTILQFSKYFDE